MPQAIRIDSRNTSPKDSHPWQPKKLYITRSRWRRSNTETPDTPVLKIDTGEYNALLGLSYSQIARQGLSFQRSQGVGQTRRLKRVCRFGIALDRYDPYRTAKTRRGSL